MRFRNEKKGEVSIDITPIVDTVFNLMIFFALSLNFLAASGLRINLPKGTVREVLSTPKSVDVSITKEGEIYVEKEKVSPENLYSLFSSLKDNGYEKVIIKADSEAKHGIVVQVLDTAKRSGFSQLAIATLPKEE
jgi:biopolymer transport protein ExbD